MSNFMDNGKCAENSLALKRRKQNSMVWSGRRLAGLLLTILLCVTTLTGCAGDGTKVVFTTGFEKDEIFRVGNETCTIAEVMVYLTNIQNQYESVYGPEVWQVSLDDVTLEENVKEIVLAKIAQIKTMYLLAMDREVELAEAEEKKVEQAAESYFNSLNDTEIELMGVTLEVIEGLYREYALADKVYQHIIQDVNPEISDDEARTITVQHILLRTYTTDSTGKRVSYSEAKKQEIYQQISEIRRQAVDGESDFLELASRHSEDSTITYSFGKGEMDIAFEETSFSLETNEVSEIIETESGYHIIKCISTFDREQTDLSKLEIVEERRREVFGQEYDEFVATLVRQLNTKVWEGVALLHEEEVTTADFFDVYDKYFGSL